VLTVAYFWFTGRAVSSSGRVTVLIDRARHGPDPELDASPAELAEAMRLATIDAFGEAAVNDAARAEPEVAHAAREAAPAVAVRPRAKIDWVGHLCFLIGMLVGGRATQPFTPLRWTLGDGVWSGILPDAALPYVLLLAGILVGFGTRMAGGCPIGHGLSGMARGQAGSWAAGLAFFASGIVVSLLFGGW
jgi:hypothetical protein